MGGLVSAGRASAQCVRHGRVTECPFANSERVAEDRVAQRIPGPAVARRALAVPMVWSGFLYARMRYGLDFRDASPEATVGHIATPVLLIHGLADETLAARNPEKITLWLVPGARHTAAYGAAPLEFPRRVLAWFHGHVYTDPNGSRQTQSIYWTDGR